VRMMTIDDKTNWMRVPVGTEASYWQVSGTLAANGRLRYGNPLTSERVRYVTRWAGSAIADTVVFWFDGESQFSGSVLLTSELMQESNEVRPYVLLRGGGGVNFENRSGSEIDFSLSMLCIDEYYWRI